MADEQGVTPPQPTVEELLAKIAKMEEANKQSDLDGISFKIGEKGGVSVLGLQRFPITLYYDQWIRLLDGKVAGALLDFLEENKDKLSTKPVIDKDAAKSAKVKGVTLSKIEADMLPGLMVKHSKEPEVLARLATVKAAHDVNGKVPFEAYLDLVVISGKRA